MELIVDFDKKNLVQKNFFKVDRVSKNMTIISRVLMVVGIVASLVYAIVNIVSPTLSLVRINGEMEKDFLNIFIFTGIIFIPLVLLGFFIHIFKVNYGSRFIDNRIDESLYIEDDVLKYVFRIKYHSSVEQREVISIDLNKISHIEYNEKSKGVKFFGSLDDCYYMNYERKEQGRKSNIDEFVIFDYFDPKLLETLKSNWENLNISFK